MSRTFNSTDEGTFGQSIVGIGEDDLIAAGEIAPQDVTEELVADHLYTAGMPDPDLMIRTAGEMRISNFLLWQIAYSEIYITPTLWPDFGKEEFLRILEDYQGRERRFGKV